MKILYAVRLFSGLQASLDERRWHPTGVPTIYKMIEALDHGQDQPVFVLACKDGTSHWPETRDVELTVEGLDNPVTVLAGHKRFPFAMPGAGVLLELIHAWRLWRITCRERPEILYLDHANVVAAALLTFLLDVPVVFRVMGVYPVMRDALKSTGLKHRFMRWCYYRAYSLIVCTQDGSGAEPWLQEALRTDVPRIAVLNGVDRNISAIDSLSDLSALPDNKTLVLFLGKLEPEKGALQFADGFLGAWGAAKGKLHALIIGTGSEGDEIKKRFAEAGANAAFTMIDRLTHSQVGAVLSKSDIYVSLNRLGNLSNANLEAMLSGTAMIFPKAQSEHGIDVVTEDLIPGDAALRISSSDDIEGLSKAILKLHNSPSERETRGDLLRDYATRFTSSWDERISWELDLLRRIAGGEHLGQVKGPAASRTRS